MNFNSINNQSGNSINQTKGSYLDRHKKSEEKVQAEELPNSTSIQEKKEEEQTNTQQNDKLPSYKAIEALNDKTGGAEAEDLYNVRWAVYHQDYEESNVGKGRNEIANVSRRSYDNSKKVISNEEDAKTHIADFAEKLINELKKQGKYTAKMQKAFEYVAQNFKWDVYLKKFPNADANKLEWQYLHTLASAVDSNRIATIFY